MKERINPLDRVMQRVAEQIDDVSQRVAERILPTGEELNRVADAYGQDALHHEPDDGLREMRRILTQEAIGRFLFHWTPYVQEWEEDVKDVLRSAQARRDTELVTGYWAILYPFQARLEISRELQIRRRFETGEPPLRDPVEEWNNLWTKYPLHVRRRVVCQWSPELCRHALEVQKKPYDERRREGELFEHSFFPDELAGTEALTRIRVMGSADSVLYRIVEAVHDAYAPYNYPDVEKSHRYIRGLTPDWRQADAEAVLGLTDWQVGIHDLETMDRDYYRQQVENLAIEYAQSLAAVYEGKMKSAELGNFVSALLQPYRNQPEFLEEVAMRAERLFEESRT